MKNKYEEIITSFLNGNITYTRKKVKHWSKQEKKALLEYAEQLGESVYKDVLNNLVLA